MLALVGVLGVLILILISSLYNRQFIPIPVSDEFDFENRTCFGVHAGYGSIYCLCNETFCDKIPAIDSALLSFSSAVSFTSSKDGLRFHQEIVLFSPSSSIEDAAITISINSSKTFQEVLGFGGAFTDAAGINLDKLRNGTREKLIHSYFGPDGLEYTIGRIPIGSTDFSTRCYSYVEEENDFDLKSFQLVEEDLRYKIPYVLWAKNISSREIKLFASPWSPPDWMKTNGNCSGYGRIKGDPGDTGKKGKYYRAWAKYFIRFLEEYKKHNISFWGLTAQNEPTDGYIPLFSFNCLGFTASEQRDFIKYHLGPALKGKSSSSSSIFADVKLLILDDNRVRAWDWVNTIFDDPLASAFVDGTAIHWYWNILSSASVTTDIHDAFPSKLILASEACDGWMPLEHQVWLGDWSRAEDYATSIVEDLNNWVVGWTDWNLALDLRGGPNWAENFVDAPIIVNVEKNEFYRQPMFYIMGHFSKFLPPSSVIVEALSSEAHTVGVVAAKYVDEGGREIQVLVIHNRSNWSKKTFIKDELARQFSMTLPAKSIKTLLWTTHRN